YIDIKVDYLVPTSTTNVQTLNEKIRNDIKERVEHFAEIPVRTLEINIRDQRKNSNEPRVV
ncbi:alkaline shock response membrane anchor protein AmaP, partial [Staphylococcus agnetis]